MEYRTIREKLGSAMNIIIVDKNKLDAKTLNIIEHFFNLESGDLVLNRIPEFTQSNKNIFKRSDLVICDYAYYLRNKPLQDYLYEISLEFSVQILLIADRSVWIPVLHRGFYVLTIPIVKNKLLEILQAISTKKYDPLKFLVVDNRMFFISKILYVKRSEDRTWIFEEGKKPFKTRTTFGKIYDVLKPNKFHKVERSTCINLNWIDTLDQDEIKFKNGLELKLQKKLSFESLKKINQNLAFLNISNCD